MLRPVGQIRRVRGGAQSHLKRCDEGYYYAVKFQNNPQHRRILVNELLGTRLAARLGLPTVPAVSAVSEELIRLTPNLAVELPRARIPCQPGLQFGSRYPGEPRQLTLRDFLPDEQLPEVENLHDFAGMLMFDKWTCNTNGRQKVFFSEQRQAAEQAVVRYKTRMIDRGFYFNAGEWNFPDAPLRGLYARNRVYLGVTGIESFAPWLERIEKQMTERTLDEITRAIPLEWYADDYDAVLRLLERLHQRRCRAPALILEVKRCKRQRFPNWM